MPDQQQIQVLPQQDLLPRQGPSHKRYRCHEPQWSRSRKQPIRQVSITNDSPCRLSQAQRVFLIQLRLLLLTPRELQGNPIKEGSKNMQQDTTTSPERETNTPQVPKMQTFRGQRSQQERRQQLRHRSQQNRERSHLTSSILRTNVTANRCSQVFKRRPLFFVRALNRNRASHPTKKTSQACNKRHSSVPDPPRRRSRERLPPSQRQRAIRHNTRAPWRQNHRAVPSIQVKKTIKN